jgi:D-alanine-D-alanine ligase
MRIALTYNRLRHGGEAEAEFDSMDTIRALAAWLGELGHRVTPVDVSCSVPALIERLRRAAPELVFNLAEGTRGRFREAFYPALFEHLGLAHTGSGASTLAVCLDKALAKRIVAAAGVQVARTYTGWPVAMPVIVKPNFEGSSKGIDQTSVVTDPGRLPAIVASVRARYSSGVLVEEYVEGDDIAVAWVDGLGVLAPIRYVYAPTGPHRILDLALKQAPDRVGVELVADDRLIAAAARVFAALGVTGYGRADFRVTPDAVYFLEMNPLPTLSPRDEDLYVAAAHLGFGPRELLAAIVAASMRAEPGYSARARDHEAISGMPG